MAVQLNFIDGRPIAVGVDQGKGRVIFPEKLAQVIDKIKTICESYSCAGIGQCCGCGRELADKILEVLECPNG